MNGGKPFGYRRQHALKRLNAQAGLGGDPTGCQGRPPGWGPEGAEGFWRIWKVSEEPGGKRLAPRRPRWWPADEKRSGKLGKSLKAQGFSIRPAPTDRRPAPRQGRRGPKPGSLLKPHLPIRTHHWDLPRSGYWETDPVAHDGACWEGNFVWSVTCPDLHRGGTANRAVWHQGAAGLGAATREGEAALPFERPGFDGDQGSELLNWPLGRSFQARPRPVGFTRSRPSPQEDNGHVEQKNWTRGRPLLGDERFADPGRVGQSNELYWEGGRCTTAFCLR